MAAPLESPKTTEQQENQPCHTSLPYLAEKSDSTNTSTNKEFEDVAELLSACEDISMLCDLREIFTSEILKEAAGLLPSDVRDRIRRWVVELNAAETAKSDESFKSDFTKPLRRFPDWVRVGQKAEFIHESYSWNVIGEIVDVQSFVNSLNEEIFFQCTIKYWKKYKRNGQVYDSQSFEYIVARLDWLVKPLPGKLKRPTHDWSPASSKRTTDDQLIAPLPAPEEKFLEPAESEEKELNPSVAPPEQELPIGTKVQHNGGREGEYHARYLHKGIIQEAFAEDYFVRFSDGKFLRCEVSDLDLEF